MKTSSISFNVTGSEGPSPSVSKLDSPPSVLPSTLDSDSSDRSEVNIDFAFLLRVFEAELWFEGTGDGVLLDEGGGGLGIGVLVFDVIDGVAVELEVVVVAVGGTGEFASVVAVEALLPAGTSSVALRERCGRFCDCSLIPTRIFIIIRTGKYFLNCYVCKNGINKKISAKRVLEN